MSAKPTVYETVNNNKYKLPEGFLIAALDKLLIKHKLKKKRKTLSYLKCNNISV